MTTRLLTCPSCSCDELDTDNCQVVCTSCGHVIDQGSYQADDDPFKSVSNYCPATGPNSGIHSVQLKQHLRASNIGGPRNISKNGLQLIKHSEKICHVYRLTNDMTKEVARLVESAYKNQNFLYKSQRKKLALCGACFYTICRQYSWPVLWQDAASAFQSSSPEIFEMFNLLVSVFDIKVPPMDVETLIPSMLGTYLITDKVVHQKTQEICTLASETWVACGRNYEPVILAAAYLAWTSKCSDKGKKLKQFSRLTGRKFPEATYLRLRELRVVILRLAKQIPWIPEKKCTADNIQYFLQDVLEFRKTLFSKVKAPEENCSDGGSVSCDKTESENAFLPPSHKKRKLNDSVEGDKQVDEAIPLPLHDLNCVELSQCDIPDSDMHEYILSPEELAERERIMGEQEANEQCAETTQGKLSAQCR